MEILEYLDFKRIEAITGIKARTLRKYRIKGKLKGGRCVAGRWLFTPEEIKAFIDSSPTTSYTGGNRDD